MSLNPFFGGGAHRLNAAAYGISRSIGANSDLEGAGAIDFRRAETNFHAWTWDNFRPSDLFTGDFDQNGRPDLSFDIYLERNKPFRFALAFLTPGTHVLTHGQPCMDLDLKLMTTDGRHVPNGLSDDTGQSTEHFDTQVTISGMYKVVVEKWSDSGVSDQGAVLGHRPKRA